MPDDGAVAVTTPLPIVELMSTYRWSKSTACVTEPGRMRATREMSAASGVVMSKDWPYPI